MCFKTCAQLKVPTRKVGMALEKARPGPPYVIDLAVVVLLLVPVIVVDLVVNATTGTKKFILDSNRYN